MEEKSLLSNNILNDIDGTEKEQVVESLLGDNGTNNTEEPVELEETDYKELEAKRAEQERLVAEHNKRVMASPEYKAIMVYNNFVQNSPYIMSGPQKRKLYRECLRNARKGKYDYLFDEEKIRRREERQRAKFEKLNKPVIHSADEVSDDMKSRLQELASSDEWKTVKPDEAL